MKKNILFPMRFIKNILRNRTWFIGILAVGICLTACAKHEVTEEPVTSLDTVAESADTEAAIIINNPEEDHEPPFISESGIPTELPVFMGSWKVMGYVDGYFTGIDTRTKKASVEPFLGKEIYFGPDQIVVDRVRYKSDPKYSTDIQPIDASYTYLAGGWSMGEESQRKFLGNHTSYFVSVETVPDDGKPIYSEVNLFVIDQNTMVARLNEGGVELKRVGPLLETGDAGEYSRSVYETKFDSMYLGEWVITNRLYENDVDEAPQLIGKHITLANFYVATDKGKYPRWEGGWGQFERLYEANILPDTERSRYDRGDDRLKELLWDADKDYFTVVKIIDRLIEKDDLLGDLIIKDKNTMYLYNRYGLFTLQKKGEAQ